MKQVHVILLCNTGVPYWVKGNSPPPPQPIHGIDDHGMRMTNLPRSTGPCLVKLAQKKVWLGELIIPTRPLLLAGM